MTMRRGQVALYLVFVLVAIVVLVMANVGVYLAVTAKNRAMNAGDAAALAVAQLQRDLLNEIGQLNVDHLTAAIENRESDCRDIQAMQARRCFLGPLEGIRRGNEAARENGAKANEEMRDLLKQHVIDIRLQYATTPELYPEPWDGAWEEYAAELEACLGEGLCAGPDNILYLDAASGHPLLSKAFYDAVAGRNWCWFHFNARDLLDGYSGFGDWAPLPASGDATRLLRSANSEIYSLHLAPKTGNVFEVLDPSRENRVAVTNLICRLTGKTISDIESSYVITNRSQVWYCYEEEDDVYDWRKWREMDLTDSDYGLPLVGSVRPEYDVLGAAAICRVEMKGRSLLGTAETEVGETTAKWSAAAKPFGTVENEDGETDAVTAECNKGFVIPSFDAVRLVPLDAVGGEDLSTADAEWMRHVREDLPAYLRNGPDATKSCYYCRQLVTWERESFREQGIRWLRNHKDECVRSPGGGGSTGGTSHGH